MWGSDRGWGPTVLLEPPVDSYRPAVMVGPDLTGSGDGSASTIVRCLGADGTVCVSTFGTDDQVPANQAMLRWVLGQTVDVVQLGGRPGRPVHLVRRDRPARPLSASLLTVHLRRAGP